MTPIPGSETELRERRRARDQMREQGWRDPVRECEQTHGSTETWGPDEWAQHRALRRYNISLQEAMDNYTRKLQQAQHRREMQIEPDSEPDAAYPDLPWDPWDDLPEAQEGKGGGRSSRSTSHHGAMTAQVAHMSAGSG